jgi:hypothetical protein
MISVHILKIFNFGSDGIDLYTDSIVTKTLSLAVALDSSSIIESEKHMMD